MNFFKKKLVHVVFFCLVLLLSGATLVCATMMQNGAEPPSVEIAPLKTADEIPEYLIQTEYALNKGQFESVLGMSKRILALQTGNINAQALLAAAYIGLGDEESAQQISSHVQESDPGNAELYKYQARAYRIAGKPVKAEHVYKDGINSSTEKNELTMLLAGLYGEQGKHEDAVKLLEGVLKQQTVTPKNYLNASFALCRIDLQMHRYDQVVKRAKQIVASYPPIPQGYMFLATAYLKKEQPEQAVTVYKQLIKINPNLPVPYQELALLYVEQLGDGAKALEYAKKAIVSFPDDGKSKDILGWVLYRDNKLDQAAEQFASAIKLAPEQAVYHYHLGLAQLKLKKTESAKKSFIEALNRMSQKESPAFTAELKKRIQECG